ncbi:allantoicase [Paractinoplanes atraurantiacus]|uniref:Probable allantoicase n=1 Tax=Paractinoplanes atraurantiacus TaxID=1036182 RepID=A0A285JJT4_9ACTN|nr:allantoicase [Actinoplanes atraurantiacus]SNY60323.1 allantoicase [Actinoplanes atraurantiacus]
MDEFIALPDLASRAFGGGVVYANDEFFAAADHLVLPTAPVFAPRTFDHKGQVYDGWETRRRRQPGSDVAIVRLGAPGVIRGVDVDTAFFTGNFPPYASIDGLAVEGYPAPAELVEAEWIPLVAKSPLEGDSRNLFAVTDERRFTHVRLTIHPDGGVARLRVHGTPVPDPALLPSEFDVAAIAYGATVTDCSNTFYGHPEKMLMPGLALHMGDGWETSRRRDDGYDWVEIRLAAPAQLSFVDLDTTHFKGNAPGFATLIGKSDKSNWAEILPKVALTPDTPHRFRVESPTVTHVRLDIFPDGGMARLRLHGRPTPGFLDDNFRRCH